MTGPAHVIILIPFLLPDITFLVMLAQAAYRTLGNRFSPAGAGARLSILIYHRVLAEPDSIFPNEVTAASFDVQLRLLKSAFNVLPLPEAVTLLKQGRLPARAACITFDDGYTDNLTLAAPILKKHGLHATFFIATGYLNGGRMFNDTVIEAVRCSPLEMLDLTSLDLGLHAIGRADDKARAIGTILPRVKYLPLDAREQAVMRIAGLAECGPLSDDLMMTTDQLKTLHGMGMEIGGHTARHPILAKLGDKAAREEIAEGKDFLEQVLGKRIGLFAYPNGKPGTDYLPEQARLVRELDFDAAVSTQWGAADRHDDFFQLPRFTPWSPSQWRFIPSLLNNLRQARQAPPRAGQSG